MLTTVVLIYVKMIESNIIDGRKIKLERMIELTFR